MKAIQALALIVMLMMSVNIANVALNSGFDHGVGLDVFLAGTSDPWQLLINSDLVSGLLFMVTWIVLRERGGRAIETVTWIWLILWWGNIVVAAYILHAAHEANGDWSRFLVGNRGPEAATDPIARHQPSAIFRLTCLAGAIITAAYLVFRLAAPGLSGVAIVGYVAAFTPIVLAFALMAMRREVQRLSPAS